MYAYTTLHTFANNDYIFIRHFCLPFTMTDAEYKEYLQLLLGSKASSVTVRFYEWGPVPTTFQTSVLSQSHEKGTIEGLPYDISMTQQDLSLYIQFVQDSVSLEKRRPVFKPYRPQTVQEPEYAAQFHKVDQSHISSGDVKPFQVDSGFLESSASTVDYGSTVEMMEKMDVPAWCTVVDQVSQISETAIRPLLFTLRVQSDMNFLREVTEPFCEDFTVCVLFQDARVNEGLQYNFRADEHIFQNAYRGEWTIQAVQTFLQELLRKEEMTLLELNTGQLVRERSDAFWRYMLDKYQSPVQIVGSLTLRDTKLVFVSASSSIKQSKLLEPYQAAIVSDLLQKAPAGLSLLQTFNMFQTPYQEPNVKAKPNVISLIQPPVVQFSAFEVQKPIAAKSQSLDEYVQEYMTHEGPVPETWNALTDSEKTELHTCSFLLFLKRVNVSAFSEEYSNYCRDRTVTCEVPTSMSRVAEALQTSTTWLMAGYASLATQLLARFHVQLKVKPSSALFQTLVGQFCESCLKREEGKKVPASEMWSAFQTFLRGNSDYPAYSTSQQGEFNETLQGFGFEQKRTAAGKVWCGVVLRS